MCCTMSFAEEINIEKDGICYILDDTDNTATVTKSDNKEYLGIPSEVIYNEKTYTVTSIGDNAFTDCKSLESVDIPGTVMSIGYQAFAGCSSLGSLNINLNINEGVVSIGESAFQGCSKLTSIEIPESVGSIGNFAFYKCSGLTSVSISEGVKNIGEYAFGNCFSLTIITIPGNVESFGNKPFKSCSNLNSVIVLATTPPTLDGNNFGVVKDIPLYVPDVQAYKNIEWGGFNDIRNVANYKSDALDDIYDAMQGERSSAYLNGIVQNYLNAINNSDDYAVINKNRVIAIGELNTVASTSVASIYKEIKTAELGSLGTEQNGPAIKVIGQDDKEVILYNPKKVDFIRVKNEE